jgi:hypothetical protein
VPTVTTGAPEKSIFLANVRLGRSTSSGRRGASRRSRSHGGHQSSPAVRRRSPWPPDRHSRPPPPHRSAGRKENAARGRKSSFQPVPISKRAPLLMMQGASRFIQNAGLVIFTKCGPRREKQGVRAERMRTVCHADFKEKQSMVRVCFMTQGPIGGWAPCFLSGGSCFRSRQRECSRLVVSIFLSIGCTLTLFPRVRW